MKIHVTGSIGLPGGFATLQWEFVPGDKELARKTLIYLENRRVLHGIREMGDEKDCVKSAIQIRGRLTKAIAAAHPGGGLEDALREMRAACADFVTRAGPDAVHFRGLWGGDEDNFFGNSLREFRSLMGVYIATVMEKYDLGIEEDLRQILPHRDADLSWLPGFDGS
jgi:hypothetical protein